MKIYFYYYFFYTIKGFLSLISTNKIHSLLSDHENFQIKGSCKKTNIKKMKKRNMNY